MAVEQNECYRLVTIGYLKSFIEQNGSTSLLQKSNGTYSVVSSSWSDTYCPTYKQLIDGSILQKRSISSTSPSGDADGIVVNNRWYGNTAQTYADNQCVDRRDLSLAYTRFNKLQISLSKTSINSCGDNATMTVTYQYNRATKQMSNCPTSEAGIIYNNSSSASNAPCSELSWNKTLGASTVGCNQYSLGENTTGAERKDNIYAYIDFRGTRQKSNTVEVTQPAATSAYTHYVSERKVATSISGLIYTTAPSPGRGTMWAVVPTNSGCTASISQPITLKGTGNYNHYKTYALESCGHWDASKTQERFESAGTEAISTVSGTLAGSGKCCDTTTVIATKRLTLNWSGFTSSVDFAAVCSGCSCPQPTECCQIIGDSIINCSGTIQYRIGKCGCDGTINLGLSVEWAEYPYGTSENYAGVVIGNSNEAPTGFTFFQFGYPTKWSTTEQGINHTAFTGDVQSTSSYPYDTTIINCDDSVRYWLGHSKLRMPTKDEAQELLDNTNKEWKTNYKGISGLNGWLLTSTKAGYTDKSIFLPAVGECYPEATGEETSTWYFRDSGLSVYIRTSAGKWIAEDNPAAYRIYCGNSTDSMRIVDSSRRYGNIIFPVCDKNLPDLDCT